MIGLMVRWGGNEGTVFSDPINTAAGICVCVLHKDMSFAVVLVDDLRGVPVDEDAKPNILQLHRNEHYDSPD